MNIKIVLLLITLITIPFSAHAKKKHSENWYNKLQCELVQGDDEYRIKSANVRVDCVTEEYAIETDFMNNAKQYEAYAQAEFYGALLNKKSGIWLIKEKAKDQRYLDRLLMNIKLNRRAITVWVIDNTTGIPNFYLAYTPGCINCFINK